MLTEQEHALYDAIINKDLEGVKRAVENGADINNTFYEDYADCCFETAFHIAAEKGTPEIIEFLADSGGDMYAETEGQGYTPFQVAVSRGDLAVIQAFINKGVEMNNCNLLGIAVSKKRLDIAQMLIEKGANVNNRRGRVSNASQGFTALVDAIEINGMEEIKFLIAHGADTNISGYYNQRTLLHIAVIRGKTDIVKLLIKHGADINVPDEDGCTPLHSAVTNNKTDVVKTLIRHILLLDFNAEKPHILVAKVELSNHWDNCKAEVGLMRNYRLGSVGGRTEVSLYDFLRIKDDNKLVSSFINERINENLSNINYKDYPIYADFLSKKIDDAERKSNLYTSINRRCFFTTLNRRVPEPVMESINKELGNDDVSRVNLLKASFPPR